MRADIDDLRTQFLWSTDKKTDEVKFDQYITRNIFFGKHDVQDSIAFLSLKREYFHETGDLVNEMYAQLKLVSFYSQSLTNEELEFCS